MQQFINYYELLQIEQKETIENIILAYNDKISQFLNLPILSDRDKEYIKLLKKAKFILTDSERREKYDTIYNTIINNKTKDTNKYLLLDGNAVNGNAVNGNAVDDSKFNNNPTAISDRLFGGFIFPSEQKDVFH